MCNFLFICINRRELKVTKTMRALPLSLLVYICSWVVPLLPSFWWKDILSLVFFPLWCQLGKAKDIGWSIIVEVWFIRSKVWNILPLSYEEYMAGDKWQTFEGVELSVDRLKYVFVRLLFVWMTIVHHLCWSFWISYIGDFNLRVIMQAFVL